MRTEMLTVFVMYTLYITSETVKSENWIKKRSHLYVKKYSGCVNTSVAINTFKTRAVYKCISDCFLNADSFFYYRRTERQCYCYTEKEDLDFNTTVAETSGPVYGFYLQGYQMYEAWSYRKWITVSKPSDCLSLFQSGFVEDGVFLIYPSDGIEVNVWCDMANGGWTVVQRRQDASVDFYRSWDDYEMGFGNVTGEFWLGLDTIHRLTRSSSSLEIKMETFGDVTPSTAYAHYSSFSIEGATTNYIMHIDEFNGDCGDSLSYHDGNKFSTMDRDNDQYGGNCAARYSGAWWYNACHWSNLNGLYLSGKHSTTANGMNWHTCWGHYYSVKTVVMKVRRNLN